MVAALDSSSLTAVEMCTSWELAGDDGTFTESSAGGSVLVIDTTFCTGRNVGLVVVVVVAAAGTIADGSSFHWTSSCGPRSVGSEVICGLDVGTSDDAASMKRDGCGVG